MGSEHIVLSKWGENSLKRTRPLLLIPLFALESDCAYSLASGDTMTPPGFLKGMLGCSAPSKNASSTMCCCLTGRQVTITGTPTPQKPLIPLQSVDRQMSKGSLGRWNLIIEVGWHLLTILQACWMLGAPVRGRCRRKLERNDG